MTVQKGIIRLLKGKVKGEKRGGELWILVWRGFSLDLDATGFDYWKG